MGPEQPLIRNKRSNNDNPCTETVQFLQTLRTTWLCCSLNPDRASVHKGGIQQVPESTSIFTEPNNWYCNCMRCCKPKHNVVVSHWLWSCVH